MRVCVGGGLGFGSGKKVVGWVPAFVLWRILDEHVGNEGGPDRPDATQAPFSSEQALDDFEFEGVGGLKRIDVTMLEFFIEGVILIGEDERFSAEPMLEGV